MKATAAFLLLLAGCAGAGSTEPAAVIELLHGRRQMERFGIADPAGVEALRGWVRECWKQPPTRNRIGSVFPSAAVLLDGQTYVAFGALDAQGGVTLIPTADLDRLAALVKKWGARYDGPARSGEYADRIWEAGGTVGLLGQRQTTRQNPDQARGTVLSLLTELGYTIRTPVTGSTSTDVLASKPTDDGIRYVRISLERNADGGCTVAVLVRTRSEDRDTIESDQSAGLDLSSRLGERL